MTDTDPFTIIGEFTSHPCYGCEHHASGKPHDCLNDCPRYADTQLKEVFERLEQRIKDGTIKPQDE